MAEWFLPVRHQLVAPKGATLESVRTIESHVHALGQCRNIIRKLEMPIILRLVPAERAAPEMVMAYGMERIAATFGHPQLSACVVGAGGIDFALLEGRLEPAPDGRRETLQW